LLLNMSQVPPIQSGGLDSPVNRFPHMLKGAFYEAFMACWYMETENRFYRLASKQGYPSIVLEAIEGGKYGIMLKDSSDFEQVRVVCNCRAWPCASSACMAAAERTWAIAYVFALHYLCSVGSSCLCDEPELAAGKFG
jgi:hypothetical protein